MGTIGVGVIEYWTICESSDSVVEPDGALLIKLGKQCGNVCLKRQPWIVSGLVRMKS